MLACTYTIITVLVLAHIASLLSITCHCSVEFFDIFVFSIKKASFTAETELSGLPNLVLSDGAKVYCVFMHGPFKGLPFK